VIATVVILGLAEGGFTAVSWGWTTIALGLAVLFVLLLTEPLSYPQSVLALAALGGYVAWSAMSLLWTTDLTVGALNVERNLVYVMAWLAAVVVVGTNARRLAGATFVGMAGICVYSVITHLQPDVFGLHSQPGVQGRLFYPLGYWNAQGLLAVLTIILGAGIAVDRGRGVLERGLAAGVVPWAAVNLLLTLSRGAEIALVLGVAVWLLLDTDRVRASAWVIGLAIPSAAAALLVDRTPSMFGRSYTLQAGNAGRPRTAELILLSLLVITSVSVLVRNEHKIAIRPWLRRVYLGTLAAAAVAVLAAGIGRYGSPADWPESSYRALTAKPAISAHPSRFLTFSLSYRNLLWSVGVREAEAAPAWGTGIGSFGEHWFKERTVRVDTSSSHSLAVETVAETGLVGLALLAVALGAPLVAGFRGRRTPWVPAVAGAYAAWLLHTNVDWDWLVPAVTIPALWCGYALVAANSDAMPVRLVGYRGRICGAIAAVCILAAAAALVGNIRLSESYAEANNGNYAAAIREARSAADWQPWSFLPWMEVGSANQALRNHAAALAAYETAARRDPARWEPWIALATVATGPERTRALENATRLNRLGTELANLCDRSLSDGCPTTRISPNGRAVPKL
jgi:hypothetical protein